MSLSCRVERLTPKKAGEYLQKMVRNRPSNQTHVRRLAGAMKAGMWKLNGDGLKFNEQGEMEDGQHRCLAVILSDTPIETLIVRNLSSNNGVFETIDTGKRRSVGDMFARAGEDNYVVLAGAIGWLWRYQHDCIVNGWMNTARHDEAMELLKLHPGMRDSCRVTHVCRKVLRPSIAAFCHYLFAQKDKEAADFFMEALGTGENISKTNLKTSGVYWLRGRLLADRSAKARLMPQEIPPLVVKAWNAMRERRVTKALKWSSSEGFPEIQ